MYIEISTLKFTDTYRYFRTFKIQNKLCLYDMKNTKMALKGSLDEMQERINTHLKAKREEHQRLIMMVKDAHERGLSMREIASVFGDVHRSTVHRWLKEARALEANNESMKSHFQSAREQEAKMKTRPPDE